MTIESDRDLAGLSRVGKVVALTLQEMKEALEPGMTTAELDSIGAEVFERHGARSDEPPTIPNYFDRRLDLPLTEGLVITIEPIIAAGSERTIESQDGWTVRTADGSPAAHHEHTIVITKGSPIVLTAA